jgi:hypothetical protein
VDRYLIDSLDLRETIERIGQHEKELRLFNVDPADAIHGELRVFFETQNVRIVQDRTASGNPEDIAVLSNATEVLALVDVASLRDLLDDVPTGADKFGIDDTKYDTVLRHLKETTFSSSETEQLLYASREIEDRARRTGQGTIHAGFQQCSIMAAERPIYTDLARRGISVHAYGVPDVSPPNLGAGHVHPVSTDEIAEMWFVVYDGGEDSSQKTALLAHQRAENVFYGAWTYDPGLVDHVVGYLEQAYDGSADDLESST